MASNIIGAPRQDAINIRLAHQIRKGFPAWSADAAASCARQILDRISAPRRTLAEVDAALRDAFAEEDAALKSQAV